MMIPKDILICPKCQELLFKQKTSFYCANNHCFDEAREGYVNLLLVDKKKTKDPGDDAVMINARNSFLEKGYFSDLIQEISSLMSNGNQIVLDAGCGSGYYIREISKIFREKDFIGVDISKIAIKQASRMDKKSLYIVASIFSLPIKTNSVDIILNIFAPKPIDEFKRVLKKNGYIIEVVPGKNHLKELKTEIFKEEVRDNREKCNLAGFTLIDQRRIRYKRFIDCADDILNLLKMTPYWYKGGKNNFDIREFTCLDVTFDFIINIWRGDDL